MRGVGYMKALLLLVSFLFGGRGSEEPVISIPPCTETLCIKPCGLHHVKSLTVSISCYNFDNHCSFINITVSLTLDVFVKNIVGRLRNITIVMGPGVSIHSADVYGDYCSHEARHGRNTCPIPANRPANLSGIFSLDGVRQFFGVQLLARTALEDENGNLLVCADIRVLLE